MKELNKGINNIGPANKTLSADFFESFFNFYNSIKIGDREFINYNISDMKKHIQSNYSPDVFRLVYINIVHCFSGHLEESYVQERIELIPQTVDEGFDIINEMVEKYFVKVYSNSASSEQLKREILRIVEREYCDPLLSVGMLADTLGISTSYLSRYFKEKAGVTLFSYIDEIRISKAKQLLSETDMPVKEIVKSVGYNDINNFNRKFKAKTGRTPSVYRKK